MFVLVVLSRLVVIVLVDGVFRNGISGLFVFVSIVSSFLCIVLIVIFSCVCLGKCLCG